MIHEPSLRVASASALRGINPSARTEAIIRSNTVSHEVQGRRTMKKFEPLFLSVDRFSEALAAEPSRSPSGSAPQTSPQAETPPTFQQLHPMARIVKGIVDKVSTTRAA